MKKIPIGISNFRELGENEYVFFNQKHNKNLIIR